MRRVLRAHVQAGCGAQKQRIANTDIGNGEAPVAEVFAVLQMGSEHAQARQIPFFVILHRLRQFARRRLHDAVTQRHGLRKGEGGVAVKQPVGIATKFRMIRPEAKFIFAVALHQVVANAAGLGHMRVAIDQIRNRAQRIHSKIVFFEHARRKGQHFQLVGQAHFLQGPQRAQ